jgi:1,4-alpha-glucan branching enzyme
MLHPSYKDSYIFVIRLNANTDMLYSFRLHHEDSVVPDPASRFQPQGMERTVV